MPQEQTGIYFSGQANYCHTTCKAFQHLVTFGGGQKFMGFQGAKTLKIANQHLKAKFSQNREEGTKNYIFLKSWG